MEHSLWNGGIPSPLTHLAPDEEFITRLYEILQQKAFDSRYSVPKLCRDIGMSSSRLHRKLITHMGQPAVALITSVRLERARELLQSYPQFPVNQIAFDCGFDDPNYFSRTFSRRFGMSPTKFRNGNQISCAHFGR